MTNSFFTGWGEVMGGWLAEKKSGREGRHCKQRNQVSWAQEVLGSDASGLMGRHSKVCGGVRVSMSPARSQQAVKCTDCWERGLRRRPTEMEEVEGLGSCCCLPLAPSLHFSCFCLAYTSLVLILELKQWPGEPETAGHRGHNDSTWKLLDFKGVMWAWERGNSCGPKMWDLWPCFPSTS